MEELQCSIDSMNISDDSLDAADLLFKTTEPSDGSDVIFNDVLKLFMKHNWTITCLEDVCKLINNIPGATINLPSTKYGIFKRFQSNCSPDIVKKYYIKCEACKIYRNGNTCHECNSELKTNELNFFAYIPIENQLKQSIEKNWSNIVNFDAENGDNGSISDVHSANILRTLYKKCEMLDGNVISLSLNTDGANKFKCNKRSIWPIQVVQKFLPPNQRYETQNIITTGIFYGLQKPDCLEFFQPLLNDMKKLGKVGITIEKAGEEYKFMPIISHCVVDLPAKHMIQCIKQYNGKNACTYCMHPGESVEFSKNTKPGRKKSNLYTSRKVIRYTENGRKYELRNSLETMTSMAKETSTENIDGVTGLSCLVSLPNFDIIKGIGVDYMHSIIGIMRKFLDLFLCSKSHKRAFYVNKKKIKVLEKRLLSIKPIREITRPPRSLDQRADYKASELKYILLYYFPICLIGIIPQKYVSHFQLLSSSLYTLLKTNIAARELSVTENKLQNFVDLFQVFYEKKNMVMNIHLLTHIVESVKNLGPLWSHSAFPFEKNNGCLLKLVKGTTDVIHQITNKYIMQKSLETKIEQKRSIDTILHGKYKLINEHKIDLHHSHSENCIKIRNRKLPVYSKISKHGTIYTSLAYKKLKNSVDYFIGLDNGIIGTAKYYICNNNIKYVVMDEYEVMEEIDHISDVEPTSIHLIAPVQSIVSKYIYMKINKKEYVTLPPNKYETE